jgi:hypothetical protein
VPRKKKKGKKKKENARQRFHERQRAAQRVHLGQRVAEEVVAFLSALPATLFKAWVSMGAAATYITMSYSWDQYYNIFLMPKICRVLRKKRDRNIVF